MSKADDMFEYLGYYKIEYVPTQYCEYHKDDEIIQFWKNKVFNKTDEYDENNIGYITMEELEAINEKVKELGWLDE